MTRLSVIRPSTAVDDVVLEGHESSLLVSSKTLASCSAASSARGGSAGIGAISIFALIIILCLAVLSVLTIATAHSSLVLAQRQATATQELYRNETAAQAFMAEVDRVLTAPGGNSAATLNGQLVALCSTAEAAAGGDVKATAQMVGQTIRADFSSQNGRTLKIALTIQPDGTYRVDSWRMVAVVNDEQPIGNLYLSEPNG